MASDNEEIAADDGEEQEEVSQWDVDDALEDDKGDDSIETALRPQNNSDPVALDFENALPDRSESAPPPGSSLDTVLQWRERQGRDAIAGGSSRPGAFSADPRGPGRRSWLAETPLSTKPNPPGHRWGNASRAGAKHLQKLDERTGVSSTGLGWENIDQWRATKARAASPFMTTARRTAGFAANLDRLAAESPGAAAYNLQYIPDNADSRRAVTPHLSFGKGRRTDVWLSRSRKSGRVSATFGRPDQPGDLGKPYSSLSKQVLAKLPSNTGVVFSQSRRRVAGERNDNPGPGEYNVRLKVGDRKDHLLRTRMAQTPAHEFPRQRRPWQRDKDYKKDKPFGAMRIHTAVDGQVLSGHRNDAQVKFALAPRHGVKMPNGGNGAAVGPGPGAYWV